MPTVNRLDPPGSYHHVMSHCVEGCRAFQDERLKQDMLERLSVTVEKSYLRVHAWALMDNHFHLLAEPVDSTLSVSMQKLLTGFACAYNRKSTRRGHVFDARFRSILVERESYYLKLLAYIHLNPLKAGMVASLEELSSFPWTSHTVILGKSSHPWTCTETTRTLLGNGEEGWRSRYLHLLSSTNQGVDDEAMETGSFSIGRKGLKEVLAMDRDSSSRSILVLGSRDFALRQYEMYRGLRRSGLRDRRDQHREMEEALARVAFKFGVSSAILRSGGRGKRLTDARRELLLELQNMQGVTQADAASFLSVTRAVVSRFWARREADHP